MNLHGEDWKQKRNDMSKRIKVEKQGSTQRHQESVMATMGRQGESQTTEALECHASKQCDTL